MFPDRSDDELLRLWNDETWRMTTGPVLEAALQERGYVTREQDGALRFPLATAALAMPPEGPPETMSRREGSIPDEPFDSTEYLAGADLTAQEASGSRPIALFLAGGALAGATSVLQQLEETGDDLVPEEPVVVDPARIRTMLPEWQPLYEDRDPYTAFGLRAEAIDVARHLVEKATAQGRNLILCGLGAGEQFVKVMSNFHDAGYEVRVRFVDAPFEIEQRRNDLRAAETGLRFDSAELVQLNRQAATRFVAWKDLSWIAMWRAYAVPGEEEIVRGPCGPRGESKSHVFTTSTTSDADRSRFRRKP